MANLTGESRYKFEQTWYLSNTLRDQSFEGKKLRKNWINHDKSKENSVNALKLIKTVLGWGGGGGDGGGGAGAGGEVSRVVRHLDTNSKKHFYLSLFYFLEIQTQRDIFIFQFLASPDALEVIVVTYSLPDR